MGKRARRRSRNGVADRHLRSADALDTQKALAPAEVQRAAEMTSRNVTESLSVLRTSCRNYRRLRELWEGAGFDVSDLPEADLSELLEAIDRALERDVPVPTPPKYRPSGEAA